MSVLLAALSGMLLAAGIWVTVIGLSPRQERIGTGTGFRIRSIGWMRAIDRAARLRLIVACLVGVVAYLISNWLLTLVVLPAGVLGVQWLLSAPPQRDAELLAALDRWVRLVNTSLHTGKSVKEAIATTRAQAPQLLRGSVQVLLGRLDDRWSTRDAFFAMADELDSPDADAVIAAMLLSAERGGTGASATLDALSDGIQDRLRAVREIATERAKPRIVVRQVTIISTVMLGGILAFGGQFLMPYRTALGTIVLLVLLTLYAGSLLMLRRLTNPPRAQRLISWQVGEQHA